MNISKLLSDDLIIIVTVGFLGLMSILITNFAIEIRKASKKKKRVILVIEGIIGAGKSTLLKILNDELPKFYNKIVIVEEPVKLWEETGALKDFYDDIPRKAYEFQTFTYCTRILALKAAFDKNSDADLFIIERSPFSDRYIFVESLRKAGFITDSQMIKYKIWWDTWFSLWPFEPTHFLYLDPGVDECMRRKEARARTGETRVTKEYQEGIQSNHMIFFKDICKYPVLKLDTKGDYREIGTARDNLINNILTFISSS